MLDFFELKELLHHFQVHQQEDSRITFIQFIHLHYGSDTRHFEADARNHQKLPFSKHHRTTVPLQWFTDLSSALEWVSARRLYSSPDEVRYFEMSTFQLVKSVWQPPRA